MAARPAVLMLGPQGDWRDVSVAVDVPRAAAALPHAPPARGAPAAAVNVADVAQLDAAVARLASALQRLEARSGGSRGRNGAVVVVVLLVAGAVYVLWNHVGLDDIVYVTRRTFETAVASVRDALGALSARVMARMTDLAARLDVLTARVDAHHTELSDAIRTEVAVVAQQVDEVGADVSEVRGLVEDLRRQMGGLHSKVDVSMRGIGLLLGSRDDAAIGPATASFWTQLRALTDRPASAPTVPSPLRAPRPRTTTSTAAAAAAAGWPVGPCGARRAGALLGAARGGHPLASAFAPMPTTGALHRGTAE